MGGIPAANPSAGKSVLMSPFSGPKGSPFDAKKQDPTTGAIVADTSNLSTGALTTGIGFGCSVIIGPTAPQSIKDAGFTDGYIPGMMMPAGTAAPDARLTCIGGGRSGPAANGVAPTNPYNNQPLLDFGNGGVRDSGSGPVHQGSGPKLVTALQDTVNGVEMVPDWWNRSGVTVLAGESSFGSSLVKSPPIT